MLKHIKIVSFIAIAILSINLASAQLNTSATSLDLQVGGVTKATVETNGNVTVTGTPSAAQNLATKAYVDAAVASAGSSGPTYMGLTTTTSNGNIFVAGFTNGIRSADDKCNAVYAGSRMMRTSDLKYIHAQITSSTRGWVECDAVSVAGSSGAPYCTNYGFKYFGSAGNGANCNNWSTNSVSAYGLTYEKAGLYSDTCDSLQYIHCVKD